MKAAIDLSLAVATIFVATNCGNVIGLPDVPSAQDAAAEDSTVLVSGGADGGVAGSGDGGTVAVDAMSGSTPAADDSGMIDAATDAEAALPDAEGDGAIFRAVALGTATSFAVLAASTISNVGTTTAVVGDVGISPGTALVNLPAGQVQGALHLGDDVAAKAQADFSVAYSGLVSLPCQHTMSGVDLGGQRLAPGVYCFAVAAAQSTGGLTLDGQGDPNAVWVFQIGSTLTIASNLSTTMTNAGNACNVYWQVGTSATINTGAQFKGNVFANASVTLLTSAKVSPGRVFAQQAAVTLDSNAISSAGCP